MTLSCHDRLDDLLALGALLVVCGQEDHTQTVMALSRDGDALLTELLDYKIVRQLDNQACSIAGLRVGSRRSSVAQVYQHLKTLFDNLVGLFAFDVGNQSDTTSVVLEGRVVQSFVGEARSVIFLVAIRHGVTLSCDSCSCHNRPSSGHRMAI